MEKYSDKSNKHPKGRVRAVSKRHQNYRLVKIHRNYSVAEIAGLFQIHKNTVHRWIREGLPAVKGQRPWLVKGKDLSEFIKKKRRRHKRPCQRGELYCVHCHLPKRPVDNMVDFEPLNEKAGNMYGICPDCGNGMNRYFSLSKLDQIREEMGTMNEVITTNKCKPITSR